MSIEFQCKQCQSTLRVPAEHAGKQAKCPKCEFINMIPMATSESSHGSGDAGGGDARFTQPPADFSNPKSQPAGSNPYQPTTTGGAQQYLQAHRGGLVLALGIISFVCNCLLIPGILAWAFGSTDLKKIKAGTMDPSGEALTRVGMILGIVSTGLAALGFLFYFAMAALSIVFEAAAI